MQGVGGRREGPASFYALKVSVGSQALCSSHALSLMSGPRAGVGLPLPLPSPISCTSLLASPGAGQSVQICSKGTFSTSSPMMQSVRDMFSFFICSSHPAPLLNSPPAGTIAISDRITDTAPTIGIIINSFYKFLPISPTVVYVTSLTKSNKLLVYFFPLMTYIV